MLASSAAILCGVLLVRAILFLDEDLIIVNNSIPKQVCNYVPRDQQTATLDSYAEVLQGSLDGLLQNVARLQQIKGNLNTVWQHKMNNARGTPEGSGFVDALNQVKLQLEQFFGAFTADATAIIAAYDAWIKASKDTFLTKTTSYQTQRDLLLVTFNDSITTGPENMTRRRQCAQHYYTQFEGIEFSYLLVSGKSYANVAGTLAAQSAGITMLQNAGEADAMRLLMAFEPANSQLQDAVDNWNTFYQRVTTSTASVIEELKTVVQSSIANVDASIAVPNELLVALGQVKNGYDLCVGMGREVSSRFSCN